MTVHIKVEASGALRIVREESLGLIKHIPEREKPWEAHRGNVITYFKTQMEAFNFVIGLVE